MEKYIVWWNYGVITVHFESSWSEICNWSCSFWIYDSIPKNFCVILKYVGHYPSMKEQPWPCCLLGFFLPISVWNSYRFLIVYKGQKVLPQDIKKYCYNLRVDCRSLFRWLQMPWPHPPTPVTMLYKLNMLRTFHSVFSPELVIWQQISLVFLLFISF